MGTLLVLNGPPGVGKTTVAAIIQRRSPDTVVISGDALRAFAPEDARAALGGGATYRVAGTLAAAYLKLGARRVIFDYVFLRPAHFDYFAEGLAGVTPRVVTLWAPLEVVLAREEKRIGPPRLGHAVSGSYREMHLNWPRMGHIVETQSLSPELASEQVLQAAP